MRAAARQMGIPGQRTPGLEQPLGEPPTLVNYFRAFAPAPEWDQLPSWPPDVFALSNLVLDHTASYRFVVAPPVMKQWPPTADWNEQVMRAGQDWARASGRTGWALPRFVLEHWERLSQCRDLPLTELRTGEAWDLCESLLTLHAVADEACLGISNPSRRASAASFEALAWSLLKSRGSLSNLSPLRVRVVPKTHFGQRGITIRSLSRYLALCYEPVDVWWRRFDSEIDLSAVGSPLRQRDFNIVLIPWPLRVKAADFRPVPGPLTNMDFESFGFFEFAPDQPLNIDYIRSLLNSARNASGNLNAVVLPESAIEPEDIPILEHALAEYDAGFLVAGVRERPTTGGFGRNYLHFGVRTATGWEHFEQDKHHRWCLDKNQIRQYHLSRTLDPKKQWWEAIDIRERILHVLDFDGTTTATLVCEDLARMDEVADLLRRIGPSVVIAVLLDGPQLSLRWPWRYAGVLADDPGSAVLTLTSFGMATRSKPKGMRRSRVVALWMDTTHGLRELELRRGADAMVISLCRIRKNVWTADGRVHRHVPDIVLSDVHQVRSDRRLH